MMRNLGIVILRLALPTKWSYSFDGKNLVVCEEYDTETLAESSKDLSTSLYPGVNIEVDKGRVSFKIEISQIRAVCAILNEVLLQATLLGITDIETQAKVMKAIATYPADIILKDGS